MRLKLKYLQKFLDRYGQVRCYLRKPGHTRVPLPPPGTAGFMLAYENAIAAEPEAVGSRRTKAGTMAALAVAYFSSPAFKAVDAVTQRKYRGIVEHLVAEHGDKRIVDLRREHIEKMLVKKAETPAAANNWLHVMRQMMRVAVAERLRADDPSAGVKRLRYVSQGHQMWSEEDIAVFEHHFPVGTMPRLAMALMLYTGCRISDAVQLGRQHIKGGLLTYTQHKNRRRKAVVLTIPVHPELQRVIDATPAQHLVFLTTGFNKPFKSSASLGNWMRARCREAGLSECRSHGLRKAIARRLAEAGMTPHRIMSITGHTTLKEVERYTRGADQVRLAREAMAGLVADRGNGQ